MKAIRLIEPIRTTLTSLFIMTCSVYTIQAHADIGVIKAEVPLQGIFAPYRGYDNTNNIEIVLHGNLPNPCYQLDPDAVIKIDTKNTYAIQQFATKRTDGVCADESTLPDSFKMVVPFTNVVVLGRLEPGDYTFRYWTTENGTGKKSLNVKEAHKTTVDDYPYAAVSNAITSDIIQKDEQISVLLKGLFTSSCAYLDPKDIRIEKQNDVYVILPILKMKKGVICTQSLSPFSQEIELDPPHTAGNYLIHVRSMNGKSLNTVIGAKE